MIYQYFQYTESLLLKSAMP